MVYGTAHWRSPLGRKLFTRAHTSVMMSMLVPSQQTTAFLTLRVTTTRTGILPMRKVSLTSMCQKQRKAVGQVANQKAKANRNWARMLWFQMMSWTPHQSEWVRVCGGETAAPHLCHWGNYWIGKDAKAFLGFSWQTPSFLSRLRLSKL